MRFNVKQNIFNRPPASIGPGDMNLRIFFENHSTCPVRCTTSGTAELVGLQRLLEQNYPEHRNYVLTHGAECELSPNLEYSVEALSSAADKLKPLVIELLEQLGHQYDETVLHYFDQRRLEIAAQS